jgi:hypothetical protein
MTRLTRKLMISILTVVLSISALGTTTFAWFTVTNVATVEQFSANIVSDTGIEISLDGENWFSSITADMINAVIPANFEFNHVTTADGETFRTLSGSTLGITSTGYLSIPIYFRSQAVSTITWTGVSLSGQQKEWSADVSFYASNGDPITAGDSVFVDASNAIRVAVIDPVTVAATPVVYEKPADTGLYYNTVLGISGASLLDGTAGVGMGADGAMNYYYEKTNGTLPAETGTFATVATITDLGAGVDVLALQATNTSGEVDFTNILGSGLVTVDFNAAYGGVLFLNVWFEGFDAEAYNSLLTLAVNLGLTFEGYSN